MSILILRCPEVGLGIPNSTSGHLGSLCDRELFRVLAAAAARVRYFDLCGRRRPSCALRGRCRLVRDVVVSRASGVVISRVSAVVIARASAGVVSRVGAVVVSRVCAVAVSGMGAVIISRASAVVVARASAVVVSRARAVVVSRVSAVVSRLGRALRLAPFWYLLGTPVGPPRKWLKTVPGLPRPQTAPK